ncbi:MULTISPECIES: zinc-dependent metalloprotease family protein [Chryseobacterium]|uniref:Reprolysin-like metallo-peptidase family M12B n=1 Tax=Chryseobacterium geocarposphaerae TaxID=1416776 RepID=A0ABU1LCP0_9FLAO|nr:MULTISPECIES: zinc-dependent metalloprotease family protein [Chryseobacterium]MDR6404497.1 hypothetical protein [Chryseobacterium geocarposphaerae]MDR6698271.1 hypothetical protein [Chryseobacterium ginsenosidimutans]
MKTKFITSLLVFCSCVLFAQNKIFKNSISENNLKSNQRISTDLAKSYVSTHYFSQPSFNLNSELQIKIPDDKNIKAKPIRIYKYSNKSTSYVYSIDGDPAAELVFSEYDRIVTGMYASGSGKKVMFHQTNGDIFAVSVVNEQIIPDEDENDYIMGETEDKNSGKINANICSPETPICGNSRIDVMAILTNAAVAKWGGLSQSISNIATAITNFNTSLLNSGVYNITINFVHASEVNYTESGSGNTDLSRFRAVNDDFMDEIHTLRTTYGADICALITGSGSTGLGYVNTHPTNYSKNSAFSLSRYDLVVNNYTLAHEIGHNMGLKHDWHEDKTITPCSHHHGYVNRTAINLGTSSSPSQRWRTITAYNSECASKGISCTRINRWSNPSLNYNSEPTGIAIGQPTPSNEVFGFLRFGCIVSEFMPTASLPAFEILSQN